jgi:hypothetical protein
MLREILETRCNGEDDTCQCESCEQALFDFLSANYDDADMIADSNDEPYWRRDIANEALEYIADIEETRDELQYLPR